MGRSRIPGGRYLTRLLGSTVVNSMISSGHQKQVDKLSTSVLDNLSQGHATSKMFNYTGSGPWSLVALYDPHSMYQMHANSRNTITKDNHEHGIQDSSNDGGEDKMAHTRPEPTQVAWELRMLVSTTMLLHAQILSSLFVSIQACALLRMLELHTRTKDI